MELYILRHGIAESTSVPPAGGDAERHLTAEGIKKIKRAAKGMIELDLRFDSILSSPLARAKETADIVAAVLRMEKRLDTTAALAPDGNPQHLIEQLVKLPRTRKHVLLVGHEPYLSRLVSVLISGDTRGSIDFKKGALCKLKAAHLEYGRCASLDWLLTSRQLRHLG